MEQKSKHMVEDTVTKEIIDLVVKKNQVYAERNKILAALAHSLKHNGVTVGVAKHPESDNEWDACWRTILVIQLNTGQMSWHFHDSERYLLKGLPFIPDYKWDGHTTEEKYKRLVELFCED